MILLITGCRSGFGLLSAVEAAKRGHTVYAGLRDLSTREGLDAAAEGLPVHPVQLDVTNADERTAIVARILEEQGRIDALVNNAGIALGGFLETVDEDELRKVMEVNFFAVWQLTNAVLPAMREAGSGRIINISSMSGRMAWPGLGAYAASKFALEGMSESLRLEVAPWGIDVMLVEPGSYKTDIFGRNRTLTRNAYDESSPYFPFVKRMDEVAERMVEKTAGDPQDVADKIVALCEGRRPRLRHPMGANGKARLFVKAMVPASLWEAIIAKAFEA